MRDANGGRELDQRPVGEGLYGDHDPQALGAEMGDRAVVREAIEGLSEVRAPADWLVVACPQAELAGEASAMVRRIS